LYWIPLKSKIINTELKTRVSTMNAGKHIDDDIRSVVASVTANVVVATAGTSEAETTEAETADDFQHIRPKTLFELPFEEEEEEDVEKKRETASIPTCLNLLQDQWSLLRKVPATLSQHYLEVKPEADEYIGDAVSRVCSAYAAAKRSWKKHN
jgi:hypothetical protein